MSQAPLNPNRSTNHHDANTKKHLPSALILSSWREATLLSSGLLWHHYPCHTTWFSWSVFFRNRSRGDTWHRYAPDVTKVTVSKHRRKLLLSTQFMTLTHKQMRDKERIKNTWPVVTLSSDVETTVDTCWSPIAAFRLACSQHQNIFT